MSVSVGTFQPAPSAMSHAFPPRPVTASGCGGVDALAAGVGCQHLRRRSGLMFKSEPHSARFRNKANVATNQVFGISHPAASVTGQDRALSLAFQCGDAGHKHLLRQRGAGVDDDGL